ncbi:fimbrial protein [Serratia sp. UGAL515B_01]|uniref:fimbrial protein n=1 Tax=Serratia sp. UGAL515B_01 TaxID=2986763 RepID=UPI002952F993|nr:fimbrial protein [Serratia sp. UGAL515B_01]WON78397.1 fimbrial protein [Serratia sp. UGAL515B_01]
MQQLQLFPNLTEVVDMCISYFCPRLVLLFMLLPVCAKAVELKVYGDLVSEPCEVNLKTSELLVEFYSIASRSFYLYPRSNPQRFEIALENCDIDLAKTVSVSFSGDEDPLQPGLLAVTGKAEGIAIGLETEQGEQLEINRGKARFTLQKGSTLLNLRAYLQASKENIEKHTIKEGEFNAVATFNLTYD